MTKIKFAEKLAQWNPAFFTEAAEAVRTSDEVSQFPQRHKIKKFCILCVFAKETEVRNRAMKDARHPHIFC
ncbi:MAG: hypothetical protein B6245_23220 [Desulfobacteraceae bacterium 4572_88]|nr:MAG: hypothetical protein B6245_23220 [Desulfobacteraceae bacterium 4572_88]